jgi:uncharacterized protein YegP (UPF0339 family)
MTRTIRGVLVLFALAVFAGTADYHVAGAQVKDKDAKAKDKDKDAKAKDKDAKDKDGAATFELYKDTAGEFRFRLRAGDGTLLATSGKGYKTKADCQDVIADIKKAAAKAPIDDQSK